jgi:hypothetical protein
VEKLRVASYFFRSYGGNYFHFGVTVEFSIVFLPMVLQIGETMVLQRGELEEKARSSYFWVFGQLTVLVGKHGFAEKLHFKLKW